MQDPQLILIGSAPSSGSTMLADLLDSTPVSACGPELEFFCNRSLFEFQRFKQNPHRKSDLFSMHSTSMFPRYGRLNHFGLDQGTLLSQLQSSQDMPDFAKRFAGGFLAHRQKSADGIVFEKTPQNVNSIDLWTEQMDRPFIFLVRDPLYVFNSLLNRGWGAHSAFATWLLYVAKAWKYLDHPNVTVVKLEEVVKDPFGLAVRLIQSYGPSGTITPAELQVNFERNAYRQKASKKLSTWEVKEGRSEIRDPNLKEVSTERRRLFESMMGVNISEAYAERFQLSPIPMTQAMERFGYAYRGVSDGSIPALNAQEWLRIVRKTARGVVEGHGGIRDFAIYANPLDINR
ncbi:MAG: sulfotransferase [Cryomorphaceae bacterium]